MESGGFNSMPVMSSAAPGADALGLSGTSQGLELDAFDAGLPFDETLLDNSVNGLPTLPFTPSYDFETFSTTFEDPFSYSVTGAGRFDGQAGTQDAEAFNEESSPQEPDNKLLGFSDPVLSAKLVDESGGFAHVGMRAELLGMFFVAEDVFDATDVANPLTCYRRNLFQLSGQVSLPRSVAHAVDDQGRHVPIAEFAASVTAVESIDGRPAEIITIPWKSSNPAAAGSSTDETKTAGAPPIVPLDLASARELADSAGGASGSGARVTIPIAWKRLQFKHATANNGRRKGLQQHYVVYIKLLGKMTSGDYITIAEIQSGPVIVRGRSPRNFDSRKDVPISGDKKLERRPTNESSSSTQPQKGAADLGDAPGNLQRHYSFGDPQSYDWNTNQAVDQPQHLSKKVALSPTLTRPPVPAWTSDSSVYSQSKASLASTTPSKATASLQAAGAPSMPINLSLSEDERSPNRPTSDSSPNLGKALAGFGANQNPDGSPLEDADLLYEYFPLSLEEWEPAVDAIYRPHVVHHVTTDFKAQQVRSKSKRYFADD